MLKASLHVNHAVHQETHGRAMREGLERHGIKVVFAPFDTPVHGVDFAVIWGIRHPQVMGSGVPCLVMERGYVTDRMRFTSVGWGGLNGRATFPQAPNGTRWLVHHHAAMQPWQPRVGAVALLCGQVPGDSALRGVKFFAWAQEAADTLRKRGWWPYYRPHPQSGDNGPRGVDRARGKSLAEDLDTADLCVTWNSNAGVDAVLAGVPTVACDRGSMAWPVALHEIPEADQPPHRPDRQQWAWDLAWAQWTLEEISSGEAWEAVRTVMPETEPCREAS